MIGQQENVPCCWLFGLLLISAAVTIGACVGVAILVRYAIASGMIR